MTTTEPEGFSVTPPAAYENEQLRQKIAQLNDAVIQAEIKIAFQNEIIAAMRAAMPAADDQPHVHDDGDDADPHTHS